MREPDRDARISSLPYRSRSKIDIMTLSKNTVCLWYDGDAEEAARFYAETFPDSSVDAVHKAPGDFPSGKQGDVLTVEFTVLGIPCLGLNGGPMFKHSEAFSFQVATISGPSGAGPSDSSYSVPPQMLEQAWPTNLLVNLCSSPSG